MQSSSAKVLKPPKYLRIWVMLIFSVALLIVMSALLSQRFLERLMAVQQPEPRG